MSALVAGVVALLVLFVIPASIIGYLATIALGIIAIIIGHRAVRKPGRLLPAAIVGLVLAYLGLTVACGLFLVRIVRILTN